MKGKAIHAAVFGSFDRRSDLKDPGLDVPPLSLPAVTA
jgi:hypothetical protein